MARRKGKKSDGSVQELLALGGIDLRARAESGTLPRAFGRDREVAEVLDALRQRRSVLLLGPAGAGKTAILHEALYRMVRREAPEALWQGTIVQMSCTMLERGARNTGEWSARLGQMVDAVSRSRDLFVYLDDIWTLREAGRYSGYRQSFATFLLPYLENKEVVLLGESTKENYTRRGMDASAWDRGAALADDPSLMATFATVNVDEPGPEKVRSIARSVSERMGERGQPRFEPAALDRAIELTRRFLVAQAFPGKLIRLLEDIDRNRDGESAEVISPATVTDAFARLTGLPKKIFSDAVPLAPDDVRAFFAERVVGQDEAIEAVVDRVTLIKAELHEPGRPLGVLLFLGPTGSGKTHMAKTLAEYVFGSEERLVRFDMSEFKHYDSLRSLTRQLVAKLADESFSVLLLDEVEKAAPDVFDLFLQAFGDGRLTDPGTGRTVDLRNTLVVMTSNLGGTFRGRGMGFTRNEQRDADERERVMREVEEYFRPEFINRLDTIVVFRPLDSDNMRQIARRELGRALQREGVTRRNILLDFREDVLDVLVQAGFSETYGARPLKRAIDRLVLLPLARRIAAEPDLHDQLLEFCAPRRTVEIETIPLAPADPLASPDGAKEEDAEWADVDLPPEPPLGAGQLELHLGRLRERLEEHTGSQLFAGLVALKDELLEEMLHPSFWDDQERAHTVNRTVYHLDRIIKRIQDLQRQVESLSIPMGTARKDPAVLARLSRRVRALESRVAIAELELLATDGEKVSTIGARLSIAPLPRGGDMGDGSWPLTLMAMYQGWAERHGYEVESEAAGASLVLRGGNLAGILGGEAGIHKRRTVTVKGEARRTTIDEALVTVSPLEDDGPETPENREVVRLYSFARAHTIRDPRTGQRSSRTRDVLQGDIDAFLVAYLSSVERPAEEGAAVGA